MTKAISIVLVVLSFVAPLSAQQVMGGPSKGNTEKASAAAVGLTLEALISEDSYELYGEVRSVAQLVSATGDFLEPIMKLGAPPKEISQIVKFMNANVESLTSSRLMFAARPARKGIPAILAAVEMSSPEEAGKLEVKLNQVVASTPRRNQQVAPEKSPKLPLRQGEPVVLPVITHSGNLVFLTDQPFKPETLRPRGHKLLIEDQKFQIARNQFAAEPIFLYFNFALGEKSNMKVTAGSEEFRDPRQSRTSGEVSGKRNAENQKPQANLTSMPESQGPRRLNRETGSPSAEKPKSNNAVSETTSANSTPASRNETQVDALPQIEKLIDLLVSDEPEWPDRLGLAISPESDSYVIRAIQFGGHNGKKSIAPFAPQLMAGQEYLPGAPFVLPDDTELLISASLDITHSYAQIRAQFERAREEQLAQLKKLPAGRKQENDDKLADPFVEFEKSADLRIRDDLLPAFGSEVAIAASLKALASFGLEPTTAPFPMSLPTPVTNDQHSGNNELKPESSPVLLISVRDPETLRRLMPQVLKGLGMREGNLPTERRGDIDMMSVEGRLAYAFVGDFLVVSTAETVKHVLDSYLDHHTLSVNSAFRNYMQWQPRQMTAEIYISPALMESYLRAVRDPRESIVPALREFLMQISSAPQAINYVQSSGTFGTLHEIHLPKALVLAAIASGVSDTKEAPPEMNENIAILALEELVRSEDRYKSGVGKGSFGTIDKLAEQNLLTRGSFENHGYRFDLSVLDVRFEVLATPLEYGKTGRRSFFVDQTGVIRGDDHQGGPATGGDKPIQ